MLPVMEYNNQVLVNRLAYSSQLPKRGDIIVFKPNASMLQEYILSEPAYPVNLAGTYLVRRVIGLPGETVAVLGGQVYINNQPLKEEYFKDKNTKNRPTYILRQMTIPANSYFVLGDNRNNSSDSHTWGLVSQSLVVGQFVRVVEIEPQRSQIEKTQLVGQTQLKSTKLAQTASTQVCRLY
jgi:signal peptidase I